MTHREGQPAASAAQESTPPTTAPNSSPCQRLLEILLEWCSSSASPCFFFFFLLLSSNAAVSDRWALQVCPRCGRCCQASSATDPNRPAEALPVFAPDVVGIPAASGLPDSLPTTCSTEFRAAVFECFLCATILSDAEPFEQEALQEKKHTWFEPLTKPGGFRFEVPK